MSVPVKSIETRYLCIYGLGCPLGCSLTDGGRSRYLAVGSEGVTVILMVMMMRVGWEMRQLLFD